MTLASLSLLLSFKIGLISDVISTRVGKKSSGLLSCLADPLPFQELTLRRPILGEE